VLSLALPRKAIFRDVFADGVFGVGTSQREVDETFGVFDTAADVVAASIPCKREHRRAACQQIHRIGKLDFAADAFGGLVDAIENVGGENITAGDGKVGRSVIDGRLFNELVQTDIEITARTSTQAAVKNGLKEGDEIFVRP